MSTSTYSWKYSVPADAQRVATELDAIYEEHGKVTPSLIVEDARNTERETHKLIEWDETVAAEKYRLEQARYIMRNIIIVRTEQAEIKEEPKIIKFRAYEGVEVDHERYFMPMPVAISREDTRIYMLKQAMAALNAFRQKYGMIKELSAVIDAIDNIERDHGVKQAA